MFHQYATGEFSVHTFGSYHCGPGNVSPKTFKWEIEIKQSLQGLDDRGFLLDNTMFPEFFNNIQRTSMSCEQLVRSCVDALWRECRAPHMVQVRIWAVPNHACVTYVRYKNRRG